MMAFGLGDIFVVEQKNLLNERYDVRPLLEFKVTGVDDAFFYAVRTDGKNETVRRFDKRNKKSKIKFGIHYIAYRNQKEFEEMTAKREEMDSYINDIERTIGSMNYNQLQQVAEYVDTMVM